MHPSSCPNLCRQDLQALGPCCRTSREADTSVCTVLIFTRTFQEVDVALCDLTRLERVSQAVRTPDVVVRPISSLHEVIVQPIFSCWSLFDFVLTHIHLLGLIST